MLNCLISFGAIVIFAFALHLIFDMKPAITPLVSVAVLINTLSLLAMADFLKPGVVVVWAIAVAGFAVGVFKCKGELKNKFSSFLSPGVILFLISSLLMLALLAHRQPLMSEWDEFSFWGISKHLMKIHDQLYTFYQSSMIGNSTPPTLGALAYFFQRFVPEFTEWICFFGYDVMFFACFCALTSAFDKKSWNNAFIVYLFGFLSPYIFEIYTKLL